MSNTKSSQEIYGKYTMLWWKYARDQADLGTLCSQAGQEEDSRALSPGTSFQLRAAEGKAGRLLRSEDHLGWKNTSKIIEFNH